MRFSSLGLEALSETNDWTACVSTIDTTDFDQDIYEDVLDNWREPTASRRGLDMSCFSRWQPELRRSLVRFGLPPGYLPSLAYGHDPDVDRLLFSLHHYDLQAAPYLFNTVLPDTLNETEVECQVSAVEAIIRLVPVVRSQPDGSSGGVYRRGVPKDVDAIIGQILRLRPVHLWLPCRVMATRDGKIRPMTPPRILPQNDKYACHVQPIMDRAQRFCAMYAAATLFEVQDEDQEPSDLSVPYSMSTSPQTPW